MSDRDYNFKDLLLFWKDNILKFKIISLIYILI